MAFSLKISEIILPWFPSELMPNKKLHWATKAKVAKKYREACEFITRENFVGTPKLTERGKMKLTISFFPPDKRRRDCDNCIAAFKAGQDGLADGLKINDNLFLPTYEFTDEQMGWIKIQIPIE